MAIYFVNASGSSTLPYDTSAKGATDFATLFSNVAEQSGDIVEVVDDGEIIAAFTVNWAATNITIRSWSGNTNKPTVKCTLTGNGFFCNSSMNGAKFENLRIYKDGNSAYRLIDGISCVDVEVTSCELFHINNDTSDTSCGIRPYVGCSGWKVRNCLIYHVGLYGIEVNNCSTCEFVNNTIFDFKYGSSAASGILVTNASATNNKIYNNIIHGNGSTTTYGIRYITAGSGNIHDYNDIYDCTTPFSGTTQNTHEITVDPLFLSEGLFNLRLQPSSPCLDQGAGSGVIASRPTTDFDGITRPIDIPTIIDADDGTDMGAFEYDPPPPLDGPLLVMTQRTARHVAKIYNLDPVEYNRAFGTFGSPGSGTAGLNFPWGLTIDAYGYYYICDYENERIVKLNRDFTYVNAYDTSSTIGRPCSIFYAENDDLYVAGVTYHIIEGNLVHNFIGVERITRSLSSVKYNDKVMGDEMYDLQPEDKPTNICRGFFVDEILLSGLRNSIYSLTELSDTFSFTTKRDIGGESNTFRFLGMVHHSNDLLYVNTGQKILKIDSSFTNVGDSDTIAKSMYGLTEAADGSLLMYNSDTKSIDRLSEKSMHIIESLVQDTGSTVSTDIECVWDVLEIPGGFTPLVDISNVLGYWRFEELSYDGSPNEVVDDSGLNNHGQTFGGATPIFPGKIGGCINYNGSSVYANMGNDGGVFDFDQNTDFSFGAWFKTTSTDLRVIISKEDGNKPTWNLQINSGLISLVLESSSGDVTLTTDGSYNDGNWHLVIATINRTTDNAILYIDGSNLKNGSIPSAASYVELATNVLVGARIPVLPERFWNGLIDETFIAQTVLLPTDVTALWNNGVGALINPV